MARKGLGKGLDSLIPNIFDENFDSNSAQSLEDMLNEEEETVEEDVQEEVKEEGTPETDKTPEDLPGDKGGEDDVPTSQEVQIQEEHVEEVKEIVNKNPRITLWSSRSSAVFRYLRKTEPEFSISKEASVLIEEAVAKKYPEIWALFEDL